MLLRYDPQPALDVTDSLLLGLLQQKARLSFAYRGRRLRLSAPAVAERMKRMEGRGVIRAYRAEVDLAKLGRGLQVEPWSSPRTILDSKSRLKRWMRFWHVITSPARNRLCSAQR